ncbi:hypothetical protein PY368_04670 [Aeromonas hydrophila]|nr:hypothetical protein [Aeromonas hydrophila]WES94185.1 hypothetical protein PY368_04670 [Aeromonas hydrophila]
MIRLPLLTTLLLLLALPTQAARLELADNLTLLASSRGKASPFERALTLPAGETGCWCASTAHSIPAPPTRARDASAPPRCC